MTGSAATNLRRQALWVVGCRVVGIGATLGSNIVAARLLGPAQFGVYLLVTTVIALGSLLAMAGLNEAALRFISESLALHRGALAQAYVRRALKIAATASLVATVVVCCGLWFAGFITGHQPQAGLLVLAAVGAALLAWQQLGAELVRAYGDLKTASLFSGGQAGGPVSNVLFLAGLATLALLGFHLHAMSAIGVLALSLLMTCPILYLGLWRCVRSSALQAPAETTLLTSQQNRELLTVGSVLLANQLLAFATQQLDIWLAGGFLTEEAVGLFGAAKRSLLIAAMPVQMAMLTIVSTIPRLYAQGRTRELERLLRGAATAAAIPGLAALVALTLFPDQILGLVFGGSYEGAAPVLIAMAAGHYVLVISGNPAHVLTMTGRHRAVLAVNLASAAVLVVGGVLGARAFGAIGLAVGSAASFALQNGVLWWLARQELGIWTHIGWPSRAGDAQQEHRSSSLPTTEPVASSP